MSFSLCLLKRKHLTENRFVKFIDKSVSNSFQVACQILLIECIILLICIPQSHISLVNKCLYNVSCLKYTSITLCKIYYIEI